MTLSAQVLTLRAGMLTPESTCCYVQVAGLPVPHPPTWLPVHMSC